MCSEGLYGKAESAVILDDNLSSWFKTKIWGEARLLTLSLLVQSFPRTDNGRCTGDIPRYSGYWREISNLRFADDIDLIAGSGRELKELTALLENTATAYGMQISTEKSKVISMGTDNTVPDITVAGKALEQVDFFRYLGAIITKDGRSTPEIKSRIAIAAATLIKLKALWSNKSISIPTKVRLLRTITISTVLYGSETWTLSAETERRLKAFEFRCYRRLLKVPYTEHRTNQSIREEITEAIGSHESLLAIVKRRKFEVVRAHQ